MSLAHFLVFDTANDDAPDEDFLADACPAVASLPGVERMDRYDLDDFDDGRSEGRGPILTLQTVYSDVDALQEGLASREFSRMVTAAADRKPDWKMTHAAMEMVFFPVAGESQPREWTAPLSYVVRYHPPAEDIRAFVEFYTTHHPQIEARFPKIRNIMCYLPIDWNDPTGLPQQDYMLGNEVVFDSLADLAAALQSPVMDDMMEDFAQLPPFGRNTHWAMQRRRIA